MARGHRCGRLQHALQRTPSAGDPQEAAVLHQRPCGEALPIRLRRSEPALGEPAASQRAVRQQVHAVLDAERRQPARRTLIEQRERHLVRHDVDAARDHHPEVGGVDVGQAKVTDEALGSSDPEGRRAFRASSDRRSSRRGTAGGRSPRHRRRVSARSTAARTSAFETLPGFGTHFVKSCTDRSGARDRKRPATSSADP